jgi:VWFA-related protein
MLALAVALFSASVFGSASSPGQAPVASFKSSVELVRVSAVVRDQQGKFVRGLSVRDFDVLDGSQPRPIIDFRSEAGGISVALLFDASGSMAGLLPDAREAAMHMLSWLDSGDEAAIYTFDTGLHEVKPFTGGLQEVPEFLSSLVPFGATSLRDAIAETALRIGGERETRRRAIVVFTDGRDNASRLTATEASAVASGIDVPVYIIGLARSIDNPTTQLGTNSVQQSALAGLLNALVSSTGGRLFMASSPSARSIAAQQITDELRHQYLIAFESSGRPGWHPLVVRARNKELVVRARSGYLAGQSRPNSE